MTKNAAGTQKKRQKPEKPQQDDKKGYREMSFPGIACPFLI